MSIAYTIHHNLKQSQLPQWAVKMLNLTADVIADSEVPGLWVQLKFIMQVAEMIVGVWFHHGILCIHRQQPQAFLFNRYSSLTKCQRQSCNVKESINAGGEDGFS